MNLRILVVSLLFVAFCLSVLSVPYATSQSSATTTTMTITQPAGSGQCTIRSFAFSAVKGDAIAGTFGSDAPINFYIVTQDESNAIQNCHLSSSARPLFSDENVVGYGNRYSALPFPTSGTYSFVFIANGPTSVPSGYATVKLSFPASTILINTTASTSSLSSRVTSSGTKSLSSTTATTIILPSSITSGSSSVTSQASSVPAFGKFETVGAIAFAVVIALSGSIVLFLRRKRTAQNAVTVEEKPSPKAAPLVHAPQTAATALSTGYGDLDSLLAGGLPKRSAVLLLSPRCDERDLLLRKIIRSALSAGMPAFYLSNDPNKIQDMASTYGENFYLLIPQAAKILSPPANLYKVPNIDSLSDLDTAFTKILEIRAKQGAHDRLLIVDLLTYSHIFLVDKGVTAGKWFSDFLARRKAEDFTVLAFLNPLVASIEEKQTLTAVFDGVIEIYERELRGRSRRFLVIKRMQGHRYSDSELMLDKDRLF